MGKTIGSVLKVVGTAALVVATAGTVIPALSAFASVAYTMTAAATLVVGNLLDPPKANSSSMSDQGLALTLSTTSTASRRIFYGMAANAGALIYRETTGAENTYLHLVIALAGHKVSSLEGFKFGGESVSFDGSGGAVGTYAGFMNLNFHDGGDAQIADASLVSATSKWTSAHKLNGIAYAYLRLKWDHEIYPQGIEKTLFTIKGRKLYDPRKDSTNGGVGVHRLVDEATWEWSENPVLVLVDYLLGIKVGGRIIAGMGVATNRIDWANIIAEANICDENVALKVGGTEARYTVNGWVDPNKTHRDNISALTSACGGSLVFQSGKWRCYVAAQRVAVKARGADDIVGPLSMQAKKSVSQKVNSIRGVYADPNLGYELIDFPPLQNQTYISEDGGNELWRDVNLPFTKSHSMAQRLAKIALGRVRMEKVIKANFTLASLQDQAMDVINFSHDRFNISNQNMICADWRLAAVRTKGGAEGLAIECTLVEDSADIYAWSSITDEQEIITADKLITYNRNYMDHGKLPGKIDFFNQVDGTEKPENNATLGATMGTDVQNIDGVVPSALELYRRPATYLNFDGSADEIAIPHNAAFNSANNTVEFWLRTTSTRFEGIFWKAPDTNFNREFGISLESTGKISATIGNGTTVESLYSDAIVNDGKWHWVAVRVDVVSTKDRIIIFIDDVSNQVTLQTAIVHVQASNEIVVGKVASNSTATRFFTGDLTEVRLWNNARSGGVNGELDTYKQKRLLGNETGLVGYWPLTDGEGLTAFDRSSTAIDGVIAGTSWQGEGGQLRANNTEDNLQEAVTNKGVPSNSLINDGGGTYRNIPVGLSIEKYYDGDVVTFTNAWHSSNIPSVEFLNGGVSNDTSGTITGVQSQAHTAVGLSVSGFTASLKIQGNATTITPRTDTGATETSADVWELHKANAAEAWNDEYTAQMDVTVKGVYGAFSYLVVGIYTNDGGGYVQAGTITFIDDSFIAGFANVMLNQTKTVTVNGLTNHAGYEYKILIESRTNALSSIDNFDSVTYDEAITAPTTVTATPVGVSPVNAIIKGGLDIA